MKTNMSLIIETNLSKELITIIDKRIEDIIKLCNSESGPDESGYFDSAEHVTGLGFVALQTYMSAVYGNLGIPKNTALSFGPKHNGGYTIAKIINDAANYWKHNNEWSCETANKRRGIIETTFNEIGFAIEIEYPLSGVLSELSVPHPASFCRVFEKLQIWKNALQNQP